MNERENALNDVREQCVASECETNDDQERDRGQTLPQPSDVFRYLEESTRRESTTSNLAYNGYLSIDEVIEENECEDERTSETNLLLTNDVTNNERAKRREKSTFFRFLHLFDVLLSIVVFSPLVSIYWYCTWSFLDDYFYTDDQRMSNLICWVAGLSILFPSYVFQKHLQNIYIYLDNFTWIGSIMRVIMRVAYIYLVTLAVILEWRGLWNLFDLYFFNDWKSQVSMCVIALTFFCLTKTSSTLISTPFFLYLDDYHHFFTTASKHEIEVPAYGEYSIDFLLTEIVECIALVAAWRGAENSFDILVFPNDVLPSLACSFGSSHLIYLFVAFIQAFIFKRFSKSTLLTRLIAEDFMYIIMFLSSVFSWKFYWDLIDYFIVTRQNSFYLYVFGHIVSFLFAVCLKVSAILVGPGTSYMDGEITEIDSYFEVNYLTTIYKNKLERDEQHENGRVNTTDIN